MWLGILHQSWPFILPVLYECQGVYEVNDYEGVSLDNVIMENDNKHVL